RRLALAARLQHRGRPIDPASRPIDGPGTGRGRLESQLRRDGWQGPPPGDVRILPGRTRLQIQRVEADLDDPHALRRAPRQDERGRFASTLSGPRPRVVREPLAAEPRRLDQIPQANVREGRDVQSVNPRLATNRE